MRKGLAEARKAVDEYKTPTMAEAVEKLKVKGVDSSIVHKPLEPLLHFHGLPTDRGWPRVARWMPRSS